MPETVTRLVMVPVRQIKPYAGNPRLNDLTVERLVTLIPKVGFNVPLVLDRNNVIVKGHSRWLAAQRLKMRSLPCVYTDADEETIRLDRLADNRVQEFSGWDDEGLARELGSLNLGFEFDMSLLNFEFTLPTEPESPELPTGNMAEKGAGDPEYVEVICHNCGNHLFVKP
jgi:ParB family transcriptional regulator, chromosome partitioning protein